MIYCDSNLFIYPVIYEGAKADAAASVLTALAKGEIDGLTCSLTIDEVLWIIWKKVNREIAVKQARRVLRFPNLQVVDTRTSDVDRAIELVRKYNIKPRDAIHAACSLNRAIFSIISDDTDFDVIEELNRLNFEDAIPGRG
jgi:hypothetical protein